LGLFRYANGNLRHFSEREGLSNDVVRSVFEDREGSIWCGTRGGADQFAAVPFDVLSRDQGLPSDSFGAILQSADGRVWLSSWAAGLYSVEAKRQLVNRSPLAPGDSFSNFVRRKAGGIWFATSRGRIGFADGNRSQVWNVGRRVDALLELDDGALLAALRGKGIVELQNGNLTPFAAGGLDRNFTIVRGLAKSRDGSIWVADTLLGLWKVSREGVLWHTAKDDGLAFPGENAGGATAVHSSGDWLYVAGPGAIAVWNGTRFQTFTTDNGYCAEDVTEILDDGRGNLFLGGPPGIYRLRVSELQSNARSISCRKYGRGDGLLSTFLPKYSHPVITMVNGTEVWFATGRGIAVLRSEADLPPKAPPVVAISQVLIDGAAAQPSRSEIGPGVGRVQFGFQALTFAAPEQLRYRYRLRDLDPNWRDSSEPRSVEYSNLKPAAYTFEVSVASTDGAWSQTAAYAFRIQPRFYEAAWFYVACAGAVTLLAATAYLLRFRQVRREFSLVLEERTRMAREIHDTLLQGFAGVAWQLDAVSRSILSDPSGSKSRLERLMAQLDRCLLEARQAISGARQNWPPASTLEHQVAEIGHLMETRGVAFHISTRGTPRLLTPQAHENLLAIAREAITNALKHAAPSEVRAEVDYSADSVVLTVADNGCGMPDLPQSELTTNHWGLVGMRERAGLLRGQFEIGPNLPSGTRIRITVPAARAVSLPDLLEDVGR
jgi:signal transduction histidine kinase